MEGRVSEVPATEVDKYVADIEFSNSCRQFYISRLKATETFKRSVWPGNGGQENGTALDSAMSRLQREMASLMDQDLSLMKQLLTLNEAIEDLKARRSFENSYVSTDNSSHDLMSVSDWSVSETDMFGSDNEEPSSKMADTFIDCSVYGVSDTSQSTFIELEDSGCSDSSKISNQDQYSPRNMRRLSEKISKASIEIQSKRRSVSSHSGHSGQDSIDSGYSYSICSKDIETII